MPTANVFNMAGEKIGTIELSEAIFGIEPNKSVLHDVVKNHLANCRQGTQSALTKGEVSYTTRKPWRQKGTGRARAGYAGSPVWYHGGVAFAPKPRDYSYTLPKKIRRLAMKSALSAKLSDNKIIVVENFDLDQIKTAAAVKALKDLKAEAGALLVLDAQNENAELSVRNIPDVKSSQVNTINVFDIMKYDSLLVTKAAAEKIQEVYA